jgi:hypothetical protein
VFHLVLQVFESDYRSELVDRFATWNDVTGVPAA